MKKIVPVILSGGSGTRLWPRSRASRPKPFIPLVGGRTLFAEALERCADPALFAPPLVVTGAAHAEFVAAEAVAGMRMAVEPEGRNTGPAIALAASLVEPEDVLLVCPSDHHIADVAAFRAAAAAAAALAREGYMVALGIPPDRPETGYGYIRRGAPIAGGFAVARFVEKPDLAHAEAFLAEGGYDWNGGVFAFAARDVLAELADHRPAMAQGVALAVDKGEWHGDRFHPGREAWATLNGESIDYAVMESTARAAVVPAAFGWSDIGNWQALHAARGGDADGNRAMGNADLLDCRNVMVETDGPRVSVVGLENVIVVVDGDEVLVTSAAGAQLVGKLPGAKGQ